MSFAVRTATIADVPGMHRLRLGVAENRLSDNRAINEASYAPYIEAGSAWVAEKDGEVVGFAAADGQSQTLWALFVDPRAEGHGVGRALHERLILWAREQGITRLSLSTEKASRAAAFYRRAGWVEAGTAADGEVRFEITLAG